MGLYIIRVVIIPIDIELVGGFNPSEKYYCLSLFLGQMGLLFRIYGKMFQTTNQIIMFPLHSHNHNIETDWDIWGYHWMIWNRNWVVIT